MTRHHSVPRRIRVLLVVVLALVAGAAGAANIAFFDDAAFGDQPDESARLLASLTSLGHTVNSFSGTTAAAWTTGLSGAQVLVIPELTADLWAAMDAGAQSALTGFVSGGGGFLTVGVSNSTGSSALAALFSNAFGFAISEATDDAPISLDGAAAAGTPFAGGPATLPQSNATEAYTGLPGSATVFYDDLDGEAVVWTAPSGSGRVALLGFDWFEQPTPTDWETVLDNAIASIQGSLQATTIPTLDQWGLIALLGLLAGAGLLLAGRTRV